MLAPGKHFYVVKGQVLQGDGNETDMSLGSQVTAVIENKFFYHTMSVRPRQEPVPWFKKKISRVVATDTLFSQANSVFKDWKAPTSEQYAKFMAYDFKAWKVKKFEKDRR